MVHSFCKQKSARKTVDLYSFVYYNADKSQYLYAFVYALYFADRASGLHWEAAL